MEINKIYNENCIDGMQRIDSNSIDCICIDPPYSVLKGHKIETVIDIDLFMQEAYRVLKKDSFISFFGMMPSITDWYLAALKADFTFQIDIVWCKMSISPLGGNLKRLHESIYVMKKGNPKLQEVTGSWEDISHSMCANGLMSVDSIFRTLSFLKAKLIGKDVKGKVTRETDSSQDEWYSKKMTDYVAFKDCVAFNKETKNFSSIWAFLPHNKKHRNPIKGQIKHPTVKSIEVLDRLIKLTSKEGDVILDCFLGSGTSVLSCINTKRNYIGIEKDKEYFDLATNRIIEHKKQLTIF